MINFVELKHIKIDEERRIRKGGPKKGAVQEMLESIRGANGLLQPGMARRGDEGWILVIGETRFSALSVNANSENPQDIKFGTTTLPPGTMPIIDIDTLDPASLLRAQLEENTIRTELTWQERCEGLAALMDLEGEDGTIKGLAHKLSNATGKAESGIRRAIARSLAVADNLDIPEVRNATSQREAFNIVKNKSLAELRRHSAEQRVAALTQEDIEDEYEGSPELETAFETLLDKELPIGKPRITLNAKRSTLHTLIQGDCRDILPGLEPGQFDLVFTDPPYGIGADKWSFKKVQHRHRYDDSTQAAIALYEYVATEGLRLCKDKANIFMFCSPDMWHLVAEAVEGAGWTVWPRPIVWIKGNEGMRPWGQMGLGYGHEAICWGTKGQKGLLKTAMDYFTFYKPRNRIHAAQKPDELYDKILDIAAMPGDMILDPFCGSGTIFRAATVAGATAVGIELDADMAAHAQYYAEGNLDARDGEDDDGADLDIGDLADL